MLCWATEESRGVVLERSGGLLELKLNRSIWNVNNAQLLGKMGNALGRPPGAAFPTNCTLEETLMSDKIRVGDILVPSDVQDLS